MPVTVTENVTASPMFLVTPAGCAVIYGGLLTVSVAAGGGPAVAATNDLEKFIK